MQMPCTPDVQACVRFDRIPAGLSSVLAGMLTSGAGR
jgi:hypothetical protein